MVVDYVSLFGHLSDNHETLKLRIDVKCTMRYRSHSYTRTYSSRKIRPSCFGTHTH